MGAPRDSADEDSTLNGPFLFGDEDSTRPMGRQLLTSDDLINRLTAMIQTFQGCDQVRVLEITRLDPPDSHGCNWSYSMVLDPAGVDPVVYGLAYALSVGSARPSWNLK
jgi:hypothetical protein